MPIPIPISYLPYVGPTGYTIQDLLVIVNHNDSPFTGVTKNTYLTDLKNYFAFTGGTVPGPTNFTGGLSANTISATTYYNLPGSSSGNCFLDFYVTNVHGCSPITIWDEVQSNGSSSSGTLSLAFGDGVTSSGDYSHAEGVNTLSVGYGSHSEGSGTTSIGDYSHTEGFDNVSGFKSFDGVSANTVLNGTVVLTGGTDYTTEFQYPGRLVLVTDSGVLILNYINTAYLPPNFEIYLSDGNINIGDVFSVTDLENLNSVSATTFYGKFSHSEGGTIKTLGNISLGEGSHSEGGGTLSAGDASHSEGINTESLGSYSHSEGSETKTYGYASHSEGKDTQSLGDYSHSEGADTKTIGDNSHAEGQNTQSGWKGFMISSVINGVITLDSVYLNVTSEFTSGYVILDYMIYSYNNVSFSSTTNTEIFLDDITINYGDYVADLNNLNSNYATQSLGQNSHSEGYDTISFAPHSHAEGRGNKSVGIASHSEGKDTSSLGTYSHSEGRVTESIGESSHSEGNKTISTGDYSHSEGESTESIGESSHAEGEETISEGYCSHSEGKLTISVGNYSHSEGYGTITDGDYQHATGMFNLTGDTTNGAFIIGNGTDNLNRSNLLVAASSAVTITGQLGIGTTGISSSAAIQIDSITQGFLPPRMSATEAELIPAIEGLMVYITGGTGAYITSKGWWGYTGNTSVDWAKIGP
jgi:hypothetical protein